MTQSTAGQPNLDVANSPRGVEEAIAHLRALTQQDVQSFWRESGQNLSSEQATQSDLWSEWASVTLNARRHVAWEKGRRVRWLGLRLQVPETLAAYPLQGLTLRLALTWWAESAQIFIDGQLVQEGDLFDCSARILLREAVRPGESIAVALRLISPGHDDGALVRSVCLYERPDHSLEPCPEPGFVADELAVLQRYTEAFAPDRVNLEEAVRSLDWLCVGDRHKFDQELVRLRDRLLPLSGALKQRQITLLGHAHLDLAWLWPVSDTWDAAERTFKSVLQLQSEFPELIFSHSSPALYAWLEAHRPALFEAIRQQVTTGRWEVAAGLWVEPEFNVISGESLVRQVLYGQRYVEQKFGRKSAIAWLPDSFGFCWQLPQVLQQGGVRYFVTQKLRWNDSNPFPHEAFIWQAPDGTPIFSLHSAPIGEGIDPIKMTDYACTWERKTGLTEALWLIGVGDHGGGPSRDMLHLARRWQRSPFFPQLVFDTAEAFLDRAQAAIQPENLPLWNDELYLEYHRGCYTTHGDQKAWNTHCEVSLYEAELWASIATYLDRQPFPALALETAWKQVLFNQFHDILPGSAITQVYDDANPEWAAAAETASQIQQEALRAIAQHIALPDPPHSEARPVVVFNGLNWVRSEVVTLDLPLTGEDWQVWDLEGRAIASHGQPSSDKLTLSFQASAVPGVGYRSFWLIPCQQGAETQPSGFPPSFQLENQYLRVQVDPRTGFLASIFDKRQGREVLSGPGNELQAFQDSGQYWDAWNIDPAYEQHRLPAPQLAKLEEVHQTALGSSIRAVWKLGQSQLEQRYRLPVHSAVLYIDTEVDWQETHVLLKAAFPIAVVGDRFTREIPFGAMTHPTQPVTPEEQAKWEVPALRWVDMSDQQSGVSLLTGYKHGVDVKPGQMRLSLLRSPLFPNPIADRGHHQFTYAIAPHSGSWQTAQIVQRAYELNQPMVAFVEKNTPAVSPTLPSIHTLLKLPGENLILSALKLSEEHSNRWILRCYECLGEVGAGLEAQWAIPTGTADVSNPQPLTLEPITLLETSDETPDTQSTISLRPWQVQTFQFAPPSPYSAVRVD
ncbi:MULTISPECIES: alpha-mannosidase [unclassified Leptolyngbya]|uniref:alpha-mannosidase n=1 Tax=unclassified Leptolyngbya TaxID=2650499 RepID=UPI00168486F9|nr:MULTISPECIES: alpha-mannosidase [unclassified Leptolyngbya]MBD1910374.1 alpha-mannosidase [Leptolyngbya sp. FACHB-8]MBD2155302.1 alpha-mannosidase [Leptolyngbya sp. FACHB-16]